MRSQFQLCRKISRNNQPTPFRTWSNGHVIWWPSRTTRATATRSTKIIQLTFSRNIHVSTTLRLITSARKKKATTQQSRSKAQGARIEKVVFFVILTFQVGEIKDDSRKTGFVNESWGKVMCFSSRFSLHSKVLKSVAKIVDFYGGYVRYLIHFG